MEDNDRWSKINQVFFAAMEALPEQRNQVLNQLCADDASLLQDVASLITADRDAREGFLQEPLSNVYQKWLDQAEQQSLNGKEFGAYRVLRKIGHGGMAEVYLAERCDHQYQRQVAVKVIRRGLGSTWSLKHFYTERQILANLDHPYISRLFDGGTTEDGLPYLILEYVNGERIDYFCDAHNLSIDERLQLFLKVCSAVQYAHEHNVIHRDLKPSNILITPEGNPKLLDFGVAKLLDQEVQSSIRAITGPLWMTPEYASPEQVQGQAASTSTDVYSLGILLYELLSGHHPHRISNLLPHEVLRAICEIEPQKPSIAVSQIETTISEGIASRFGPGAISQRGREQPQRLCRRLAGDLDNIVLMAIQKEPRHRYSSVDQFAQDIGRKLQNQPVIASKDSLAYRSIRYMRRNRLRIIAAAVAIACLITGALVEGWHAEREKLRLRTDLLHRLNNIFEAHDEEPGLVVNASSVIFDSGQVSLKVDARERLARIAGIILAYPNLAVRVEGYTDNRGDGTYNLAISQERAQAVELYLISQGISSRMITAKGLGGAKPIASNGTEEGRQRNRRVEIIISGNVIGGRVSSYSSPNPLDSTFMPRNSDSQMVQQGHGSNVNSNYALNKNSISSTVCNANEGPEKAFNGSISAGNSDKWCSHATPAFLQVDLGRIRVLNEFVIRHAGAGGEPSVLNTREFNIQISTNGRNFVMPVRVVANTKDVTVHTIPDAVARFVRINITRPTQHGDSSSRIYELEIYCDPAKEHLFKKQHARLSCGGMG